MKKKNDISNALVKVSEKTPVKISESSQQLIDLLKQLTPKQKALAMASLIHHDRDTIAKAAGSTPGTYSNYYATMPVFRQAIETARSLSEYGTIEFLAQYNQTINTNLAVQRRTEILNTSYKDLKTDADKRTQSAQIDSTLKGTGIDKQSPSTLTNILNYIDMLPKEINVQDK